MATLLLVSVVGFVAQLIDGAIGMAFGITATSVLLALSYSPAAASAIVHFAKIATGIASGAYHWKFGNVDRSALIKVAIPGALGAFVGAIVLSSVDLSASQPWTATVLIGLGLMLLIRFSRPEILGVQRRARARWLAPLGLVGGVVDATGGGGWGPIVTTTLTASRALTPRKAIGTTNTAEILVAIAASLGFLVGLGGSGIDWFAVTALVIGGVLAAPIAAKLVSVAPQRFLGLLTGGLVVLLNVRQLGVSLDLPVVGLAIALSIGALSWAAAIVVGVREHRLEQIADQKDPSGAD